MLIRMARKQDAFEIAKVHVTSWQETYKGIIDQGYLDKIKVDQRLALWNDVLSIRNVPVYVAENSQGQIVGFASFGIRRPEINKTDGELYAIYLMKEYKRKGIGKALFEKGLRHLMDIGVTTMSVWVLGENPSRAFYKAYSPVKIKVETVIIGNHEYNEELYFWKDLSNLIFLLKNNPFNLHAD